MTTLVLAAHGSADPRSASNARAVANQIRFIRPGLDVRVAFCDLNTPRLEDVVTPGAVVTPFLLADAYHARIDIPGQIAELRRWLAPGRCAWRGRPAGRRHARAAGRAGSQHKRSRTGRAGRGHRLDARRSQRPHRPGRGQAHRGHSMGRCDNRVRHGYRASPAEAANQLRRRGARRVVIAPWFLAPGRLTDRVAKYAAAEGIPMAAPLGAHRLVVETVLDRFDAAVAEPVAA